MKKLFSSIAVLLLITLQTFAQCPGASKKLLTAGGDGGKYFVANDAASGWYLAVVPGDTLMMNVNSSWTYFTAHGITGTASCPVTIMPSDTNAIVNVSVGIKLEDCGYVNLTGRKPHDYDTNTTANDSHWYGFLVKSTDKFNQQVSIEITGKSHHILAERIKVDTKTFGVWAKQDPLCDTTYNYNGKGSFRMNHITIRQNDFYNLGSDCIYAGNTDPTGVQRTYTCNGSTVSFVPMRLADIDICYNRVRVATRTGIQLSGADTGINKIRYNLVTDVGYEWNNNQGDGIANGGMTQNVYIYGNTIKKTFLYGIMDFGFGHSYVYSNTIDSVGLLDTKVYYPTRNPDSLATALGYQLRFGHYIKNNNSNPENILASTKQTVPDGYTKTVHYYNNQLGYNSSNHDSLGVIYFADFSIYDDRWTQNNQVCSNTKLIGGAVNIYRDAFNMGQTWPVYSTTGCPAGGGGSSIAPIANCINKTVKWPGTSTTLVGSGTDPDGTIASYQWTKISGPGSYAIVSPTSATTSITGLVKGNYIFRLTVTDNSGLTGYRNVTVTVKKGGFFW